MGYVTRSTLAAKGRHWIEAVSHVNLHRATPVRSECALLVVDMQNYFVDPGGRSYIPEASAILDNVATLLDAFRSADRPVVFTAHGHKDPRKDGGMLAEWWGDLITEGTWDSLIVHDLAPLPGEAVVRKRRYSAFAGTRLASVLRADGVGELVIAGVMTNLCCETSARDSFMRGFRTFFVADATATVSEELHLASLKNLAYGFATVLLTRDVQAAIRL
jgi:isochorismate hydrolase